MSRSLPYHDFLISNLKYPNYAAVYLETHIELEKDEEIDPKLIQLALYQVTEALGEQNKMTPEQIKNHQDKLDIILSYPGSLAIYHLGDWLNKLGLKLTVNVAESEEKNSQDSAQISELSHS